MKKSGAPNFEQLIEWLEGRLSPEEARLVAAQVAADEVAQADVAWLRTFYRASQSIVSADPPRTITERLEQRFAAYAHGRRRPSAWQRLVASLSFDSHAQLATSIRTAATSETQRQLVYTTDMATVVFTLQWHSYAMARHDGRFDLLGQILPAQEGEADLIRVALLKDKDELDSTISDDLGEFSLTALPAGFYDLVLSSDQYEITISSLDLSI
jgi:hypothetical protein